ncbi:hypothetical protein GMOD_00006914 [Pyrenophora seminiperda CCB06]|uniref:Uncharacterized protein n=1 Tax=Pyrenophora seminiperda CCB06 TaxID=1302712 RepID=A0A3M7MBA9_9PLEO|nr:hypothetical protein GMOD_00006914 [Pyrenophora seminiperda CCB06]
MSPSIAMHVTVIVIVIVPVFVPARTRRGFRITRYGIRGSLSETWQTTRPKNMGNRNRNNGRTGRAGQEKPPEINGERTA